MTIKIVEEENISTDQETSIAVTTNTTFRFESFTDHGNRRLELHNRNRTISKKRIINVYIKKDDDNEIELRNYRKRNIDYCTRN